MRQDREYFETGKVYSVLGGINACPDCGFKTDNKGWAELEDGDGLRDLLEKAEYHNGHFLYCRLAFCICGNVFVRRLPSFT